MSEPLKLSKVLGLEKSTLPNPRSTLVNEYLAIQERNRIIDEIDQLSPDEVKLVRILTNTEPMTTMCAEKIAKAIIKKMKVWIVKKG